MRYRLNQVSWIGDRLLQPGAEIDFDGTPGPHMDPLDAEARAARADYDLAHPLAAIPLEERLEITPLRSEAP